MFPKLICCFRSAETGIGNQEVSREKPKTAQFTYQSLSANISRSLDGLPAKASGSLDGLPANSSSSLDGLPAKGSGSLDGLPAKASGSLDELPAKASGSLDGLPAKGNGSLDGLPAKGSGSFDGPFRKPRAPALPKRKMDRSELMAVFSFCCVLHVFCFCEHCSFYIDVQSSSCIGNTSFERNKMWKTEAYLKERMGSFISLKYSF